MGTLYPPQAGSPETKLSADITDTATEIPVIDVTVLPSPPNILTMVDGLNFESIIYKSVDSVNNKLTNVTRGVEGTAQSWNIEQPISRNFTAKDLLDLQNELTTAISELTTVQTDLESAEDYINKLKNPLYKITSVKSSTTLGEITTGIMSDSTLGEITTEIMSATTN